jgi:hypothetical protein
MVWEETQSASLGQRKVKEFANMSPALCAAEGVTEFPEGRILNPNQSTVHTEALCSWLAKQDPLP